MFLSADPWVAGSGCGWESIRIPGENRSFSVLTSVEDFDGPGEEMSFLLLNISEGRSKPLSRQPSCPHLCQSTGENAQPKVMNPALGSPCRLLLSFFDSLRLLSATP